MEDVVVKWSAEFLKALAHPVRIQILRKLTGGERCVCEIQQEIDIEQSNLSQHLGVLKRQGLIDTRKEGTKVIYRIVYPSVIQIIELVEEILSQQIKNSQGLLKHLK